MLSFSAAYFEELARRLNADADWAKKAGALTAKITLTATDLNSSFMLEIADGKVSVQAVHAGEPADFKFEGAAEVWQKIVSGLTDFQTAVLTGKMKFRGSLPKIMGIQPQMNRLTAVAKEIASQSSAA